MAQFLPLYEMSRADFLMILRTFARVFPRCSVFFTGTDTVLLGFADGAGIHLETAAKHFQNPGVRESLAEIGIDSPERLLDMLVLDIEPGVSVIEDGPVNSDNHPFIEFSVPRSALNYQTDTNQKILLDRFKELPSAYLTGLSPEAVAEIGRGREALRDVLEASVKRSHGDLRGTVWRNNHIMRAWLLPENIEDVLPPKAWKLEGVRRAMLDLFRARGFELVVPPLIEYVDSLLTGAGSDLDLKTFKLVDQLSGRMMGVRADMTPQVARIDAHLLGHNAVNRLCYVGSVLHTVPDGVYHSREPMQLGAELYGVAGAEGDLEILSLMLDALQAAGLKNVQLDIGHVGIYRALVEAAGLSAELEKALFKALQTWAADEVTALCAGLDAELAEALVALTHLYGGVETLQAARTALPNNARIQAALDTLAHLADSLQGRGIELAVDLAELRGYGYHSGVVFAAYTGGHSRALALGGRYDEAGKAFGRARPATGFSRDLRELVEASPDA